MSVKLEIKKDRNVSLSLANNQITEIKGSEMKFGTGYTWRKLSLPIKIAGKPIDPSDLRTRLELLQERHVNYLDSLPNFMKSLGLEGAQTDEMVPLIYPYYSLFGDIDDDTSYINLLEFATHLLLKLDRYDLTKIKNDGIFDQKNFIIEAKKGIKKEMSAIQQLIGDSKKDIEKLKGDVKKTIANIDLIKEKILTQSKNDMVPYDLEKEL